MKKRLIACEHKIAQLEKLVAAFKRPIRVRVESRIITVGSQNFRPGPDGGHFEFNGQELVLVLTSASQPG